MAKQQTVVINNIPPVSIKINVVVGWRLKFRIRMAVFFISCAAWSLGGRAEVSQSK
jgi:hypothetical protein